MKNNGIRIPSTSETRGKAVETVLGLLLALVCFASAPLFLRYLARFPVLDAWTVNAVRYGLVAGCWIPFVIHRLRRLPQECRIWRAAIAPSLANTGGQICWALAAYHNEAGVIAFVVRSSFLFSTLYSIILLPCERATVRRPGFWLGATGIATGLILLFSNALHSGKSSPLGLTVLLLAAASWGLYWVLVKRNLSGFDQRLSFAVNSIYTSGALFTAMLFWGDWPALVRVPLSLWGVLAISALIGLVFSHVLLYRTIHHIGPVVTSGATCVQPFLTAIGAWLFLGEILMPTQWIGGCILVGSSFILLSLRLRPVSVPPIAIEPDPEDADSALVRVPVPVTQRTTWK